MPAKSANPLLVERVERLMSIPGIGPITALTWALEIGEVQRISSIKKAISYCGLCGDEQSSANAVQLRRQTHFLVIDQEARHGRLRPG